MEHFPTVLLVKGYTVDDDEGLGIGIDGIQAVHRHHRANAWCAVAHDGADARTQFALDVFLYGQCGGIIRAVGLPHVGGLRKVVVQCVKGGGVHDHVRLFFRAFQSGPHRVAVGGGDVNGRGEDGYFQLEAAIVFGQRTVSVDAMGADQCSAFGREPGGIHHASADSARFYFLFHAQGVFCLCAFSAGTCCVSFLCLQGHAACHHGRYAIYFVFHLGL